MVAKCRLSFQGWLVLGIGLLVFILYYFSDRASIGRLPAGGQRVVSVRSLLIECVRLAESAGSVIKNNYRRDKLKTSVKTGKGGPKNELLTQIDLKSHFVIVNGLNSSFSTVKVVSEEHPKVSSHETAPFVIHTNVADQLMANDVLVPASDLTVWVDPLDATQELTEGLLEYVTVMICIALHGYPIAGVVHQPFLKKTYWAWGSNGLSKDLVDLLAKKQTASAQDNSLVITHSRSHLDDSAIESIKKAFSPQKVQFLPAGGSGFKVLQLLSGNASLYVHPSGTRKWDVCAAQAIVEAAGGRMTGLDGSTLTYGSQSEPHIPNSVGLFAAPSAELYNTWKSKLAVLLP